MELSLFAKSYAFLLGLVLGSFLNVCIHRLPRGKSIIKPSSSCPNCGTPIKFYDNIPVLSYFILLGRCRHCRHPISWQYPAVEMLSGFLSLLLFITYGISYQYLLYLLFCFALVIISFVDLRHQIIPDILSLPGILAGVAASFAMESPVWLDSIIGAFAGGGTLYLVALLYESITGKEGMGGGDIKLLAMIGAWMGWRALPLIVLISSLTGAVVGAAFLLLAGKGLRARIPFGPFLSLGAVICLLYGPFLTRWYVGLFL